MMQNGHFGRLCLEVLQLEIVSPGERGSDQNDCEMSQNVECSAEDQTLSFFLSVSLCHLYF